MSSRIASIVQGIAPSGIRSFFEVVQSMGDVISLGIGEPDFVTPWHIREAAIYSLERGKTSYTSNLGAPRLRNSIAAYVQKHFGVLYDPRDEILVSVGVSEAIDLVLRAILNPGDEVIYHEPSYVSYAPTIALAGGHAIAVTTTVEDHFVLRAAELEKKVTSRTKAVLINFPNNPTGATMPPEELEKIAAVCVRHDLLLLTDEIYSELTYEGVPHPSVASMKGMKERTVLLHGVSKAFAMTGWRIGFACGPSEIIEAMMKIHQYSILCASIMGQEATIEALDQGEKSVAGMREEYEHRRNFIVTAFREHGLQCSQPGGAFYVFPNISSTGLTSKNFALQLLQEKKVAVVPGTAFGPCGEGFVRCSYATGIDQLKIAAERIGDFIREKN